MTLKLSFPCNTPQKKAKTIKSPFLLLETMRWVPFAMQPSPLKLKEIEPIQPTSIDWWHILDSTWAWLASLGEGDVPHLAAPFVLSFIISLIACSLFFTHFICQIAPFLEWTQCVSYHHSPTDLRNCRIPISSLCLCFGVFKLMCSVEADQLWAAAACYISVWIWQLVSHILSIYSIKWSSLL